MLTSDLVEKYNTIINDIDVMKNMITIGKTPTRYETRSEYFNCIKKWCVDNKISEHIIGGDIIWFKVKDDALKFKLALSSI